MHLSASFDGVDSSALQRGVACEKVRATGTASSSDDHDSDAASAGGTDDDSEYQLIVGAGGDEDASMSVAKVGVEIADPGVFWTVFPGWAVLTKSMMGVAYLSLPSAFNKSGWLLGLILLVIASSLGFGISTSLLLRAARKTPATCSSLSDLAARVHPALQVLTDLVIGIGTTASCVAFTIVGGILMPTVSMQLGASPDSLLAHKPFWVTFVVWGIAFPLGSFRRLYSLRFTSAFGAFAILYATMLIMALYFSPTIACDGKTTCSGKIVPVQTSALSILSALPLFVQTHSGATVNVVTVARELPFLNATRARIMIGCVMLFSASLYVCCGLLGYLTYGSFVKSNVLDGNYPGSYPPVTVGRIAEVVAVTFTLPLFLHPVRSCCVRLLQQLGGAAHRCMPTMITAPPEWIDEKNEVKSLPHWVATIVLTAIIWIVGLRLDDLGSVFSLFGSTTSIAKTMWIPGLIYWRVCGQEAGDTAAAIKGLVYAALGVVLSILCVYAQLQS